MEKLKQWRGVRKTEEVAALLCVTPAMWSRWETGARLVPANRVLEIERLTGVSRHELRPDVFGSAPVKRSAVA
jgi:DNA-binding transcriptional regulator YdaS (Cro superfamily)